MSLKIGRIAALAAALGAVGTMLVAAAPASAEFNSFFTNWTVSGYLTPKTLNEPVTLPQGSTFNGGASLEINEAGELEGTLTGKVVVPPFNAKLKLLGLVPTEVGVTFTQVGEPEGTLHEIPRSNCTGPMYGIGSQECVLLKVPTKANVGITFVNVSLLGLLGIGATTRCVTAEPVTFPLTTTLTLGQLISTGPEFKGTVTIPPIKCEGLEGIVLGVTLTAVMSGPDNAYSLRLAPPPPPKFVY
jgi:hypothetical protein